MKTLRIATRGSQLALWQANHVRDLLIANEPDLAVELVVLKTTGDRIVDRPLQAVGGKGLFVKEIEEALQDGRADLAVHSMKDLPTALAEGLAIVAVPKRADASDALCLPRGEKVKSLDDLAQGARVGTSSLRRLCQLKQQRPDLHIEALRGNVDTRLRKLDEGQYDAIVLAAAGLDRLGLHERIALRLPTSTMLPAVAQGALALECRADDAANAARVGALDHAETHLAVEAERAFLARLEGGCQTPIAAHAILDPSSAALSLRGLVGSPDGSQVLADERSGVATAGRAIGAALADALLARGAASFLRPA